MKTRDPAATGGMMAALSSDPLYVLAVLAALIALSEWLVQRTVLRHLGAALLVIVLAAVAANSGLLPPYRAGVPVYAAVFRWVAPLSIFWLLLQVNLRAVLRAGLPMLALFLIGSLGTFGGVLLGMWVAGGKAAFGDLHHALGGMFVGTYTGGSVNFNAVALRYQVQADGTLYAGATVVDNIATTAWMAACVALPRLLLPLWRGGAGAPPAGAPPPRDAATPLDLAVVVALGALCLWFCEWLQAETSVPAILSLTTLALLLAQWGPAHRLAGARLLGMAAVYLFLAVIGVACDLGALGEVGALAGSLGLMVGIAVAVHGLCVFGAALLLRIDPATAAVASQANIGGSTSALALARSLGRQDLVLPGVLAGSLGLALGTYLGLLAAALLGPGA